MARSLNKKFFGPTANDGSQIVGKVKFDGGAAADGYIVKQVSARRYLFAKVSDPTVTIKAKLVNTATPSTIGTASIAVVPYGESTEYAMKITAKKVVTFDGNTYKWNTYGANETGEANIFGDGELTPVTATAIAVLKDTGAVTQLSIVNGGTGYAAEEDLVLNSTLLLTVDTVDEDGVILTYTITDGADGYIVGDTVTVDSGSVAGADAEFEVTEVAAPVDYFVVTNTGSGYTTEPNVTVEGDALASATIENGIVTEVTVDDDGGPTYTVAPTVTIDAP